MIQLKLKKVARYFPRRLRNALRSPRASLRWWWNELQPPVPFELRPGWTFQCPRNAMESSFRFQLQDPDQVRELDDFITLVRSLPVVRLLDVGAHFGVMSLAAVHFGQPLARAWAVDPSEEAGRMLRRIVSLNGLDDSICVLHAAVGDATGVLDMVDTGVTGAGYMVLPQDHPQRDRQQVPLLTLDSLVERLGETPTLIKIDVEGAELEVLQGGSDLLSGHDIPLCLELHNGLIRERGAEPAAVLEQLKRCGYTRWQANGNTLGEENVLAPEVSRTIVTKA
jgi:FkbM family methyltransferase